MSRHASGNRSRYDSGMDTIRDGSGRIIATISPAGNGFTNVYDGRGTPLGYSTVNGTFDNAGRLISPTPGQYGLLVRDFGR